MFDWCTLNQSWPLRSKTGVCGSRQEILLGADAGFYRCTTAEDCPRSSRVSVCVTDVSPQQECVKCEDTICTKVIPEACN